MTISKSARAPRALEARPRSGAARSSVAAALVVTAGVASSEAQVIAPKPELKPTLVLVAAERAPAPRLRPERSLAGSAQRTTAVAASIRTNRAGAPSVETTPQESAPLWLDGFRLDGDAGLSDQSRRAAEAHVAALRVSALATPAPRDAAAAPKLAESGAAADPVEHGAADDKAPADAAFAALEAAVALDRAADVDLRAHASSPAFTAEAPADAPSAAMAATDAPGASPAASETPNEQPEAVVSDGERLASVAAPVSPQVLRGDRPAAPPIDQARVSEANLGPAPKIAAPALDSIDISDPSRDPAAPETRFAAASAVAMKRAEPVEASRVEETNAPFSSVAPKEARPPARQTAIALVDAPPRAEAPSRAPTPPTATIVETALEETDRLETIDAAVDLSGAPDPTPTFAPSTHLAVSTQDAPAQRNAAPALEGALAPLRIVEAARADADVVAASTEGLAHVAEADPQDLSAPTVRGDAPPEFDSVFKALRIEDVLRAERPKTVATAAAGAALDAEPLDGR